MGFPISGLLAEFRLGPLEAIKLDYTPHAGLRYVVVNFITWQRNDTLINNFLTQINNLYCKIKFTLEVGHNGTLPYLDVLLIKSHHGMECNVYRKPIANQVYYPNKMLKLLFLIKFLQLDIFIRESLQSVYP